MEEGQRLSSGQTKWVLPISQSLVVIVGQGKRTEKFPHPNPISEISYLDCLQKILAQLRIVFLRTYSVLTGSGSNRFLSKEPVLGSSQKEPVPWFHSVLTK